MHTIPTYFEAIRLNAARRWDQLEQDPELAAPWHQLFKQVQSPRHVLSELLQNADDARATEATVRIEDGVFIFEHNGEDFAAEHFVSLCRFGYSNKRALHTIGFRGIGFKSTFSLGDTVELFTPTLAVTFHRKRFTEPHWQPQRPDTQGKTQIRVVIADQHRQRELEKNFGEWLNSPLSLLFFKHIRRMEISSRIVHWGSRGLGPVANSEWMVLYEQEDEEFLLIRSAAEPFPPEALAEIKQERMLDVESDNDFPPCSIELVLGAEGRLFVVLPTGVETTLPFACNAPFIQDPARLKIKDPEISPTNRWLLERAGRLAASAMMTWLQRDTLLSEDRASAYALLSESRQQSASLDAACGTLVQQAFDDEIADKPFLLSDSGELLPRKGGVLLPDALFEVWPTQQVAALFDAKGRQPLYRHIDEAARSKLLRSGLVEQISTQTVISTLTKNSPPKPQTWRQLLSLWAYLAPEVTPYQSTVDATTLRILPVQGQDVLYAAREIVRLGDKKLLQSDADWEFLAGYLIVLNPNWSRFLGELRQNAADQTDSATREAVNGAFALLAKFQLTESSDANKVMERVISAFFVQKTVNRSDCVRIAQIAAKLNIKLATGFQYVTRDNCRRPFSTRLLFDETGELEELLPTQGSNSLLLHADYTASFSSCSRAEWLQWIASGRSGLHTFVPLTCVRREMRGRRQIEKEARRRGLKGDVSYPYTTHRFVIDDWDFEPEYQARWAALTTQDSQVWRRIVEALLTQRQEFWQQARYARFGQVATTNNMKLITNQPIVAAWVASLREKPCLRDTRGTLRKPDDLLRRTAETEPLLDVEPFIESRIDTEANRPLLDLLGVRSTPTGPERLLDRLRALAKAPTPPAPEVEKWYYRLDQMLGSCSTAEAWVIKVAFQTEKLLFTQEGVWEKASATSLAADEDDVPGLAVVRTSLRHLTLWRYVGVSEQASIEQALGWLKTLSSGSALATSDAQRVRKLQIRYPDRVWNECLHWLNLEGEWVPVESLRYAFTMQSLNQWSHLHSWVKQKTADFRRLPSSVTLLPPFSDLPQLAQHIEDRLDGTYQNGESAEPKEWLNIFGQELQRVRLDDEEETKFVRTLAERLTRTKLYQAQILEVVPYIEDVPAGTARHADVLWIGETIYAAPLPRAKLARHVPEVIGAAFARPAIKSALDYSFERSPKDIREYLAENFTLDLIPEASEEEEPEAPESNEPVTGSVSTGEQNAADEGGAVPPTDTAPDSATTVSPESTAQVNEGPPSGAGDDPGHIQTDPGTIKQQQQEPLPRPRPAPQPVKLSLIERFARTQGFRQDGHNVFVHADGSRIARTDNMAFPWERTTRVGDLVRYYWPKEHCLNYEPLQLEAASWNMLDHYPETYALILVSAAEEPVEYTGSHLLALRGGGAITLHPATYRLVYQQHDDH